MAGGQFRRQIRFIGEVDVEFLIQGQGGALFAVRFLIALLGLKEKPQVVPGAGQLMSIHQHGGVTLCQALQPPAGAAGFPSLALFEVALNGRTG